MCFACWLRSGFSHFINMNSLSFTWYLVAAESRISKQSGVQDALQNSELTFNGDFKICKLKMTDVPSKHVWKIKESCYVYTAIYIVAAI